MNLSTHKLTFLNVSISLLSLISCTSPRTESPGTHLESTEGFFEPEKAFSIASKLEIQSPALKESIRHTGWILSNDKWEINPLNKDRIAANYCTHLKIKELFADVCKNITSSECSQTCHLTDLAPAGSGIRFGSFFVTARHVADNLRNQSNVFVVFFEGDSKTRKYLLKPTKYTFHNLPYDFSIYRINGVTGNSRIRIREADMAKGEAVFGVGFPNISRRKHLNLDYAKYFSGPRVTFGTIANANEHKKSFCNFTNVDNIVDLERFELEDQCPIVSEDRQKQGIRIEHDPILTHTDMTFGMSGSPLFDKRGAWIGIGSNILSNEPLEYHRGAEAVYAKVSNIINALRDLGALNQTTKTP